MAQRVAQRFQETAGRGFAADTFPYDPEHMMKIRPAVASDRQRILEILEATARFTELEIGWAMELVDLALTAPLHPEYEAHVIEEPGTGPAREVRGYALFGPTPKADGVFDLYWIAVEPASQGKGLGRLLLRFVENEVRRRDGRMLLIETSSKRSYEPTHRFYQRAGYGEISRIKDFYRKEDDKIVFCRTWDRS
jgi:ribosomal protein S18 acetylase RimI-like enzyme